MQERTAARTFDVKFVPVAGGTQVGGMTIDKVDVAAGKHRYAVRYAMQA